MFSHGFVMQYLVSFLDLQSSRWGRKSRLLFYNYVISAMLLLEFLFFAVPRVGLWSVIVAITGHTHSLFNML